MNIHDIASRCGVSVATVSRVLNNSPNVSPKTREKIIQTMLDANYVPNAFAKGFGRNSMRIVGILCADIANLYYAKAVSLLEQGLRRKGFDVLLYCTGSRIDRRKDYLSTLIEKRVDTIVLVGSAYREERDNSNIREAAQRIPIFFINACVQIPNVFCVYCDEKAAMRECVRRMASEGCRDILYIHDMKTWAWAGSQKLAGYRAGLAECGIAERPELIQDVDNGILPAQQKAEELIRRGVEFSGVLASEDLLAIGAQKALLAVGKADIPIIGFNNSQFATCCTPSLSSMDNMLETLCSTATNMIDIFFSDEPIPPKVVVLGTLVERETFPISTSMPEI